MCVCACVCVCERAKKTFFILFKTHLVVTAKVETLSRCKRMCRKALVDCVIWVRAKSISDQQTSPSHLRRRPSLSNRGMRCTMRFIRARAFGVGGCGKSDARQVSCKLTACGLYASNAAPIIWVRNERFCWLIDKSRGSSGDGWGHDCCDSRGH